MYFLFLYVYKQNFRLCRVRVFQNVKMVRTLKFHLIFSIISKDSQLLCHMHYAHCADQQTISKGSFYLGLHQSILLDIDFKI